MKQIIIALVLALAVSVSAATITDTQSQSFTAVPNYDHIFTFNKFDPALGTLLSVQITLDVSVDNGSLVVDNDGVQGGNINVDLGADATLAGSEPILDTGFNGIPTVSAVNSASGSVTGNDTDSTSQFDNDGGPDNFVFNGTLATDSDGLFINPIFHSNYTGSGSTFTTTADVNTVFNFSGLSGLAGSFSPVDATVAVTVVYKYDDGNTVPEPSTVLSLVIAGALALVRLRRK